MKELSILIATLLLFCTTACSETDCKCPYQEGYIPDTPNYTDPLMWVKYLNNTDNDGADVFYVPSTWEFDWTTPEGIICHYADPSLDAHRANMKIEIDGVADYMAEGNNFYSPFYRHITLNTWATLDENLINQRYSSVSFVDVKNAFDYFMDNFNGKRPFILAGFSQGGKSVVELMKVMTPEQQERMVAAYVLGYKVTPDDLAAAPWIKGAKGADDTGVTVCYNSVSGVEYVKPIVAAPNEFCINPVNWRTDTTPATLDDTITVTLNPAYNVLVVNGYDGSSLPNILDILNVGDYHGAEPWLYSECLRENFQRRISAFHSH